MTECGVVEIVGGAVHDHDVPLRIDIAAGAPGDLGKILDIHVLGHHEDVLGQHHEPEPPQRVHDLARLPGIALLDRDDDEIVEDTFGGHVHVHHFGQHEPDDGKEDAFCRL